MAAERPLRTFCCDAKIQPQTNMEPSWNNTSVFLGNDVQFFPEPLRAHGNSAEESMGLPTDFKKKMQQTKRRAPFGPVTSTRPFPSLHITNTINMGMKMH